MSEKESIFIFIVGLLMAGFGVGGVENSIADVELLISTLVTLLGLALMWCGVRGLQIRNISVDQ